MSSSGPVQFDNKNIMNNCYYLEYFPEMIFNTMNDFYSVYYKLDSYMLALHFKPYVTGNVLDILK